MPRLADAIVSVSQWNPSYTKLAATSVVPTPTAVSSIGRRSRRRVVASSASAPKQTRNVAV